MAEQTFEEAMKRLEEIVRGLEGGELSLENSLEIFEEGMKLVSFCSNKLEEVEKKVTMLIKGGDGTNTTQPFEMKEGEEA